jgi:hypothetical protein
MSRTADEREDAMTKRLGMLAALLLLPSVVWAVPTLSFDNATLDGGAIAYDGAGGIITARDVIFQTLVGVETPVNAGTLLFCVPSPCLLSFTTGPNAALEGPPIWTFEGGGSIVMIGGLNTAEDGSGLQVLPGGSLLVSSGSFDGPEIVLGGGAAAPNSLLFAGGGLDTKHPLLAAFFGLAPGFTFVTTELSLGQAVIDPATGAFTAVVTDGDFQNTAAVPGPPTAWLVGLGLVSLALRERRS